MVPLHGLDPTIGVGMGAQTRPLSVLLVEDDRGDALLVEELVAEANIEITHGVGAVDRRCRTRAGAVANPTACCWT